MTKYAILLMVAAAPIATLAQSALDIMTVSQSDFKGTARFMSMGGAFTALGGDLSSIGQNPAGLGIYRSSEVGISVDFDFQSTKTQPSYTGYPSTSSQTKVYCNSFGYVGATILDGSALKTFNWGVSYNRVASFDRRYRGYDASISTSLSDYIAAFTTQAGAIASWMEYDGRYSGYNPYLDNGADWLSILAYNAYMINPSYGAYTGLSYTNTEGKALYSVRETGTVDEYNISFGGNVENMLYWGMGVGITDLHYTRSLYYDEYLTDAAVYVNDISYRGTAN